MIGPQRDKRGHLGTVWKFLEVIPLFTAGNDAGRKGLLSSIGQLDDFGDFRKPNVFVKPAPSPRTRLSSAPLSLSDPWLLPAWTCHVCFWAFINFLSWLLFFGTAVSLQDFIHILCSSRRSFTLFYGTGLSEYTTGDESFVLLMGTDGFKCLVTKRAALSIWVHVVWPPWCGE